MDIALQSAKELLDHFDAYDIIPEVTTTQLSKLTEDGFLFRHQLDLAESIHLHIKVAATDKLPHQELIAKGGVPQNEKDGYIKYAFPSRVHLIFSSIPVSQEEKAGLALFNYPHLDHIGIDIRKDDATSYDVFNQIPDVAGRNDLAWKRQGGDGTRVHCCHVSVNEKYWVYPNGRAHFEFAFGPLRVSDTVFGCDLRPADPSLELPEEKPACCAASVQDTSHAKGAVSPCCSSLISNSVHTKKSGTLSAPDCNQTNCLVAR